MPGLIWGSSFFLIAEGLEALPPNGITFLRFVFGFAALALVPGARRPVLKEDRRGIVWLGLLWLAIPMSLFPFAEQYVSSALTGMLNGVGPLITTAFAAVLARRAPTRTALAGLLIGLTGAILMGITGMSTGHNSVFGIALVLTALVFYGGAVNIAQGLQRRNGALPVVWRAIGVAMIAMAPLGIPALMHAKWAARPLLAVAALGFLGTAAANALMAASAGRFGAARASGTVFLIPVVALLLGVWVRGERVPPLSIAGAALSLAGAWTLRLDAPRPQVPLRR